MPVSTPKNLRRPDESVRLPGVEEDLVHVGDEIVARIVQHPGWRWSTDMRSIAGGKWCETHHVGLNLSGRQGAELRDGTVLESGRRTSTTSRRDTMATRSVTNPA